jgi:hypothetical protein
MMSQPVMATAVKTAKEKRVIWRRVDMRYSLKDLKTGKAPPLKRHGSHFKKKISALSDLPAIRRGPASAAAVGYSSPINPF